MARNEEAIRAWADRHMHMPPDDIEYDDEREVDEYVYIIRNSEREGLGVPAGTRLVHCWKEDAPGSNWWELRHADGTVGMTW